MARVPAHGPGRSRHRRSRELAARRASRNCCRTLLTLAAEAVARARSAGSAWAPGCSASTARREAQVDAVVERLRAVGGLRQRRRRCARRPSSSRASACGDRRRRRSLASRAQARARSRAGSSAPGAARCDTRIVTRQPDQAAAVPPPAFDAHHPPDGCAHRQVRALRLLPADVSDLRAVGRGDGFAARPHLPDEVGPRRPRRHDATRFVGHFDACLGCMACVTACPSGVQYAPLIEATRGADRAPVSAQRRRPAVPRGAVRGGAVSGAAAARARCRCVRLPDGSSRCSQRSGLLESAAEPAARAGRSWRRRCRSRSLTRADARASRRPSASAG